MDRSGATVALIPARGGSKGVPGKNVRSLGGYPLIAYAIVAARLAGGVDRVIVSTDSPGIGEIAKLYGAEVPFLRPAELAQDASPDVGFFRHALEWFRTHEDRQPELFVHLRPTTPLRDAARIAEAIRAIRSRDEATGLRSVHELPEPPQKMMGIAGGFLVGLFPHETRPEYYNLPRQSFPPAYHPNGYVDIVRADVLASGESLHGKRILGFVTPPVTEVDRPEDLEYLEFVLAKHGHPLLDHLRMHFAPAVEAGGHPR